MIISPCQNNQCMQWLDSSPYFKEVDLLARSREYLRGKHRCTIDLLFDWFGVSCMTTDNFCFYLQNRLIQTSQKGGQQYSDTSPFSIPLPDPSNHRDHSCTNRESLGKLKNLLDHATLWVC
jgi:hypothetical protein